MTTDSSNLEHIIRYVVLSEGWLEFDVANFHESIGDAAQEFDRDNPEGSRGYIYEARLTPIKRVIKGGFRVVDL